MPAPVRPTPPPDFDDPLRPKNPLVGHRWILGGIGVMILASLAAVYFAIGLLFWQGQWQLIFHPSQVVAKTPASAGISFDEVRFDATETGRTQLTGWWIPATTNPHPHANILYLHDARGSLSDALPDLVALHALGYDIFAFDPRGYGRSEWAKPSEKHWIQDADAALYYLASMRHVGPSHLVIVGRGLGGTLGADIVHRHDGIPSLAMIAPAPPTLGLLKTPRWTHILPVRLLAADHFDPRRALESNSLDKLFLLSPGANPPSYVAGATAPVTVIHAARIDDPEAAAALREFLSRSRANTN